MYDTPQSHVTRDWREERASLGDLSFRLADTSGAEPAAPGATIQVMVVGCRCRWLCELWRLG